MHHRILTLAGSWTAATPEEQNSFFSSNSAWMACAPSRQERPPPLRPLPSLPTIPSLIAFPPSSLVPSPFSHRCPSSNAPVGPLPPPPSSTCGTWSFYLDRQRSQGEGGPPSFCTLSRQVPVMVSDLDFQGKLWIKLRLAPMCPWIGTIFLAFVGPPRIQARNIGHHIPPHSLVRVLHFLFPFASSRRAILHLRSCAHLPDTPWPSGATCPIQSGPPHEDSDPPEAPHQAPH